LAEGALTKALGDNRTAEAKRRVQDLVKALEEKEDIPERHLLLRAIEVLELLGTPDACQLLGKLEQEATVADVAQEAKASLQRLHH
jgi:hypothetical protein